MELNTTQMQTWSGGFGKDYTDRNNWTQDDMQSAYRTNFGVTRLEMNSEFIGQLDRATKILEVGSNVGNQLICLQSMGFHSLYGIELQPYAVELSKSKTKNINIIQGSAFDIPFRNRFFDLVFTSGVLIHIAPIDLKSVLQEIHRCTSRYVWGFEYYAAEHVQANYRGHESLMWKGDFASMYLREFERLALVKEKRFKYRDCDNMDSMYLLESRG